MTDSKDVKLTIRGGLSNEEVRRNIAILPWRIIYNSFQQPSCIPTAITVANYEQQINEQPIP